MIEQATARLRESLLAKWSPMDFTAGCSETGIFVYMHRRGMFGGEVFEGFPVTWVYLGRCQLNRGGDMFYDGDPRLQPKETAMTDDLIQVPEAEYREAVKALGKVEVLEETLASFGNSMSSISAENTRLWAANALLRSAATRACGKLKAYSEAEEPRVPDDASEDIAADIATSDDLIGEIVDLWSVGGDDE